MLLVQGTSDDQRGASGQRDGRLSRFKGNQKLCPGCGISYGKFRTGLTYRDVFIWLWVNSDDPKDWKYKRRRTVLGKWHAHKRELFEAHVNQCLVRASHVKRAKELGIPEDQYVVGVPF